LPKKISRKIKTDKYPPGRNPKTLKNMSQPGKTNNPAGRPPGSSYKTFVQGLFVDELEKKIPIKGGQEITFLDAYLKSFRNSALSGGWAAKMLGERLFEDDILEQIDKQLNKSRREDADFLSYRIHKSCHDIQQRILLSKEKKVLLMAGRRSGKSEADIRKAQEVLTTIPDSRVLFIGLSFTRCLEVFWEPIVKGLADLGFELSEHRRTEGIMKLPNGSEVHFRGNTSIDEREKIRGSKWDLVVIDEAQSQKALAVLIEDIIEPTLIDRDGQLFLSGTGPKVRGTYWEELWSNVEKYPAARFNWNITQNPFIPNYLEVLADIRKKKKLTEKSPLYLREYLGQIAYDDDALVYRLSDHNYFTDADLLAWIESQPRTDIRFTAGLDYGFSDADAFAIVAYSVSKPGRFLVYEYKGRRTGISALVEAVKQGIEYVKTSSLFASIPDKDFYIYADAGGAGKKISVELATAYGLPTLDAYKVDKPVAIETLQDEVRQGEFRVRPDGIFADEALKTVFARNEKDELTRLVDDDTYHPDMLDAVLYSLRLVWINNPR